MAHHIDNLPDIFDFNRIVPNEENKSSKEPTNNNSNGPDTKTHDSCSCILENGLEFREEEAKPFLENWEKEINQNNYPAINET